MALPRLPKRNPDTHKGDYGNVLVLAGSRGMVGAAVLASDAALRSGAGLSTLAVPRTIVDVANASQRCAVVKGLEDTGAGALAAGAVPQVLDLAKACTVAAIGPGLGQDPQTILAVRQITVNLRIPFVLDADGLNSFTEETELLTRGQAPRVLTPHPGELSRLVKKPIAEIQADREGVAKEAAKRFMAVCVLKGHRTIVTDGAKIYVNKTGNPGMATGGSGDVLTGVIAALLGQGLATYDAACLGVYLHGLAGDIAAKKVGEVSLIATDILAALPDAFRRKK